MTPLIKIKPSGKDINLNGTTRVEAFVSLVDINWRAPWLAPWRSRGEALARDVLSGASQPGALNAVAQSLWPDAGQAAVRFVPQADLPAGMAYEAYIFQSRQCPTREGLHDFFNGLVWLNFPLTKARLNQLHMAQIARTGIAPQRGPARDALTVFDENAALLSAPDVLWDALVAKDWSCVFGDLRPLWQQSALVLFGHALMEKLVYPRKPITAHVWRAKTDINNIANLDACLARDLGAGKLAAKPFAHLPVLGVPGWWPDNEDPGFYDDATVFRPPSQFAASASKSA